MPNPLDKYAPGNPLKDLLRSQETKATTLYVICLHEFGDEIHEWDPEMWSLEIEERFGVEIPRINSDKLNALVSALTDKAFYTNWQIFGATCEILNGFNSELDEFSYEELTPAEMAWAVFEVKLVDDDLPVFHVDVATFVGSILGEYGFLSAPGSLSFASIPDMYLGMKSYSAEEAAENTQKRQGEVLGEYISEQITELLSELRSLPFSPDNIEKILMDAVEVESERIPRALEFAT